MLDANGRLTVTLPTAIDGKHNDQDYRIEARVTDAANREVAGHSTVLATYGSFRVSVEPTSYVVQAGQPARVKVTAQDYDGEAGADAGAHRRRAGKVGFRDSPAQRHARSQQRCRDRRRWHGAGRSAHQRQRRFRGDRQRADAGKPDRARRRPGSGSGTARARGTSPTRRRRSSPTRRATRWATRRICCLSPACRNRGPWSTAEGDSVQSRRLIHATGASVAFDVPITQQAQPNLVVTAVIVHDDQLMTAQKSLKVPLSERTLTITATPGKDANTSPAKKAASTCWRWIPRASRSRPT